MKTRLFLGICLTLLGIATTAQAKTYRRFTLILDFNTCVADVANPNIVNTDSRPSSASQWAKSRAAVENTRTSVES